MHFQIFIKQEKVEHAFCTCTIGQSGYCEHITALLYQLAHKKMTLEIIPTDVAKTSLPQTWHIPRGPTLHGDKTDNIVVQGYDRGKSAVSHKRDQIHIIQPYFWRRIFKHLQFCWSDEKYGYFVQHCCNGEWYRLGANTVWKVSKRMCVEIPKQTRSSDYILNLMENNAFPDLP